MKTLVVLAALAAVAAAVPALPGYSYGSTAYSLPTPTRREKKSAESLTDDVPLPPRSVVETEIPHEFEARTFGLKKPLLFKSKLVHPAPLYRDSGSEGEGVRENLQEACKQQVIVKECESKPTSQMRSADDDEAVNLKENHMKHSIKMAKEAIENLQKATQSQKEDASLDSELHEDIELARQALEHIQKNFGNLETMNLRATTLSDAEVLKDKRANSEAERMAQWKDTIDNLQKNSEISRNIEDSDKTGSISKESESSMKISKPSLPVKSSLAKSSDESTFKRDSLVMGKNAEHVHEMLPAASELKESALAHEHMSIEDKQASLPLEENKAKKIETENIKQEKSSKTETPLPARLSGLEGKSITHEEPLKAVITEKAMENEHHLKESGNLEDLAPASSMPVMRTLPAPTSNIHNHEDARWSNNAEKTAARENEHAPALFAELNQKMDTIDEKKVESMPHMEHAKTAAIDTTLLMKSSELTQKNLLHDNIMQAKDANFGHPEHHQAVDPTSDLLNKEHDTVKARIPEVKNMKQQIEDQHQMASKSSSTFKSDNDQAGQGLELRDLHSGLPVMRVPELSNVDQQLHQSPEHFQTQGKSWHAVKIASKDETFKEAEFARTTGGQDGFHMGPQFHHHHTPHMIPHHHQHHMTHVPMHGHFKSVEMDSAVAPSSQVNLIDVTGKAAMDHGSLMSWKQKESARGAYGLSPYGAIAAASAAAAAGAAGAAAAAGSAAASAGAAPAVGVFPGAHVGGCAVPLLLSCSPSVVPGTLAKTSSYAAPHAYRSAQEFDGRFHTKRDIKKVKGITKQINRTPTKVIQSIPLNKKL